MELNFSAERALFARQRRGLSICVRGIVLCVKCHSTKTRIPSDGWFVVDDGRRQGGQTGEVGMLLAPLVFSDMSDHVERLLLFYHGAVV